ncbi:YppG family protein [Bacillus sp. CLL-7-23]|uniref:YppG family protein n=1 Tax=Bacillus changyiensis TaxID=3004103 RepID=A0ABT4X071_9BACI|nr:YppG family protein [Bacillus changyiensis]MDA7025598.1 YppG family protein [Bacillus changyiensis]
MVERAARYPYAPLHYSGYSQFEHQLQHYYDHPASQYAHPVSQAFHPSPIYQSSLQGFPYPNPYPQARPDVNQPSQLQNFMSQFKKKNGQLDFSKMMDTAGQMMSTVNQLGSLAKSFIGFFK